MDMTFPINYSHMVDKNITNAKEDMERKDRGEKRLPTKCMDNQLLTIKLQSSIATHQRVFKNL